MLWQASKGRSYTQGEGVDNLATTMRKWHLQQQIHQGRLYRRRTCRSCHHHRTSPQALCHPLCTPLCAQHGLQGSSKVAATGHQAMLSVLCSHTTEHEQQKKAEAKYSKKCQTGKRFAALQPEHARRSVPHSEDNSITWVVPVKQQTECTHLQWAVPGFSPSLHIFFVQN